MRSVVASHGPGSNPREEISRHDIAEASPERRPAGAAATTKLSATACETPRQGDATPCADRAQPSPIVRPAAVLHTAATRVTGSRPKRGQRAASERIRAYRAASNVCRPASFAHRSPSHVATSVGQHRAIASGSVAIFAASARPLARRARGRRGSSVRNGTCCGAAMCGGAGQSTCDDVFGLLDLKFNVRYNYGNFVLIRSKNTGSDTTVGDPDHAPPTRQRKNRKYMSRRRSI
ncbi:hypothetical protein F511_31269 [Dorcoceras hygrometricum]|uniref:Uncharacterized protein n=1 Tax=Dorcoceras hygrometricum TaxID=472368 RepID=A0A2Z7C5A0_9LAMI|nr:hypothetical protein F511_31269 [Dorcoceras hygrometricum]